MDKLGFDNQKYLELQSAHIRERIRQFGNKLYLEFGGKLFDDHHASRVLPGFEPDSKIRMLKELRDSVEVVLFSDEIHSDLIFHGKRHTPTASVSDEAARYVVTGISGTKTFNLAGLQASTVVFPNAHMKQVFDQFWMNMDIHRNNAFSLTAMEAAFNHGEEWLEQLLPYLSANFDFVADYCREHIPQIKTCAPDATYLMWLDCRALGLDNDALRRFMIEQAGLGLNDGCSFGRSLNGYMRLNAACPRSVLERAMKQLEAAVKAL